MKKTIAMISLASVSILSAAIYADSNVKVVLTDPKKAIVVKQDNDEFTITMQANPTTGYGWYLTGFYSKYIEPEGMQFIPPTKQLMGAPGVDVWKFKIDDDAFKAPMLLTIRFVSMRPWDVSTGKKQTYRVVTTS